MNSRDALNKSREIMESVFPQLDAANQDVPGSIEMFMRRICNRFGLVQPWAEPTPEQPIEKKNMDELRDVEAMASELEKKNPMLIGGIRQGVRPADDDPWKHRSAGMRCRTCIWFVAKEKAPGPQPQDAREVGRCRRHAPTMGGYPVVFREDWCGDHRLDENKA